MWCPFKKYSDVLGSPNKGIHSYRFLNVAIVDLLLALLLACLITWITNYPLVLSIITVLFLGFIFHVLFGVNTGAVKFLGLSC